MVDHNRNPRYYGNNKVNTTNKRRPKTFQERIDAQTREKHNTPTYDNTQNIPSQKRGTSGIYKITNDRTNETYIGQSKNIERRIKSHEKELRQGTHHNKGMQWDYLKGDTFTYTVLEETSPNKQVLNQKEEKYISQYNSFNQGYNQTPGGQYDKYKGYYGHGGGRLGSSYQQTNSHKSSNINDISQYTRNYNKSSSVDLATARALNDVFKKICIGGLLILFVAFVIFIIGCINPYLLNIYTLGWALLCIVVCIVVLILLALVIDKIQTMREVKAPWKRLKFAKKECLNCNHICDMIDEKCPNCGCKFYSAEEILLQAKESRTEEEQKEIEENKAKLISMIDSNTPYYCRDNIKSLINDELITTESMLNLILTVYKSDLKTFDKSEFEERIINGEIKDIISLRNEIDETKRKFSWYQK